MLDLKRLLCLLLAMVLCLSSLSLASAELILEDEDELALEDEDDSGFSFDDADVDAALDAVEIQWEVDTSVDPNKLDLNENLPDHVINILLIGIDSRSRVLESGNQRGDVMIILSVNTQDGSVKLTSIMRDLYVTIPGYKNKEKINAAYSRGGAQLAMRTVNSLLEMNIEYYVTINFYGLASIIDAVGGIDIELTKAEAKAINKYLKEHPPAYDNKAKGERVSLEAKAGVQHLDGVQAVMYARLRENLGGDFARTARQRNLLNLLLKKIMADMDMNVLINLVNTSMQYVKTNMSMESIVRLAIGVMPALMSKSSSGETMLGEMRIPMGDSKAATWKYDDVTDSSGHKSSVVVFRTVKRRNENIQALHEFIYGRYYPAK